VGGATVPALRPQPPLLDVDVDGALVTLRARYDPELVERLKQLPGRRYLPEETAWVLPARREALVALAQMLVDLGDRVELSERARRRLHAKAPAASSCATDSSRSMPPHALSASSASGRCPSGAGSPSSAVGEWPPHAPARWP
jgi:hypothetical protein